MLFNRASITRIAGTVGLSIALSLGASSAFADDDEPEAYLYDGSCADLEAATVVDDISDLDDDDDDVREHWEFIGNGQDMPDGLMAEEDDVDEVGTVQDMVDGEYAVVVHETEDRDSAVLVCGDIDGDVENDSLLIELDEVDGSGFEGRAFMHPDDDDDDDDDLDIEFVVGIYPAGSVDPLVDGTPES